MKENELIPGARYVPHQKTVGHPTWVIWDCLKNSETPYITYLGKNTDSRGGFWFVHKEKNYISEALYNLEDVTPYHKYVPDVAFLKDVWDKSDMEQRKKLEQSYPFLKV